MMDELGPDEQRCLDALRVTDMPTGADRARVRAAVLARLAGVGAAAAAGVELGKAAAGAGAKAASAQAGGSAFATFLAPWKLGLAAVSFIVVGGASSLWLAGSSPNTATRPASSAIPATATTPSSPLEAAPIQPVEPSAGEGDAVNGSANVNANPSAEPARAIPAAPARARAPASPATATPSPSGGHGDDIDGELVLLTEAQQALGRGDANAALVALARHGRDYPRGALAVERDGLRAIASCEAKHADGRALAERFVSRSPRSPLVARVRATCLSP